MLARNLVWVKKILWSTMFDDPDLKHLQILHAEWTFKPQMWTLVYIGLFFWKSPFKCKLTAVCAVMWVQPTTLAPARGFSPWARFLRAIRAGISERGGTNKTPMRAQQSSSCCSAVEESPSFHPDCTSPATPAVSLQASAETVHTNKCVLMCAFSLRGN